jgi:hypothetical protein
MRRVVLAFVFSLLGCRGCDHQSKPAPEPRASPASVRPLFDDNSADPYNELYRQILGRMPPAHFVGCANGADAGCGGDPARPPGLATNPGHHPMPDYVERPVASFDDEAVAAIVAHTTEIARAVDALAGIDSRSRPAAAALLQHDLWTAFDELHPDAEKPGIRAILDLLGKAILRLALPPEDLAPLGPTLDSVVAAQPELFGNGAELVELIDDETDNPSDTPSPLTTHARLRSSRSVFRRYVRVPGGPPALEALVANGPSQVVLPEGSVATLVETPLTVTRDGQLAPLRMVTLAEVRRIHVPPPEPRLADLTYDVLEGSRAALRSQSPQLVRLALDAPFPSTGSCGHDATTLVPLRQSCLLCHGTKGEAVRSHGHGTASFRIAPPKEAEEVVLRSKAKRADFRALQRYFTR